MGERLPSLSKIIYFYVVEQNEGRLLGKHSVNLNVWGTQLTLTLIIDVGARFPLSAKLPSIDSTRE